MPASDREFVVVVFSILGQSVNFFCLVSLGFMLTSNTFIYNLKFAPNFALRSTFVSYVVGLILTAMSIVHTTFLAINWNWRIVRFDVERLSLASVPMMLYARFSLLSGLFLIIDRCRSLFYPEEYFKNKHYVYLVFTNVVAFALGTADVMLQFRNTVRYVSYSCLASPCLCNDSYRSYWAWSNFIIALLIVAIMAATGKRMYKRYKLCSKLTMMSFTPEKSAFYQNNRTFFFKAVDTLATAVLPAFLNFASVVLRLTDFDFSSSFLLTMNYSVILQMVLLVYEQPELRILWDTLMGNAYTIEVSKSPPSSARQRQKDQSSQNATQAVQALSEEIEMVNMPPSTAPARTRKPTTAGLTRTVTAITTTGVGPLQPITLGPRQSTSNNSRNSRNADKIKGF